MMRYVRCDVISLLKLTMASRRMFSASFSALGKEHQPHLLQIHHSQPLPASILAYRISSNVLFLGGQKGPKEILYGLEYFCALPRAESFWEVLVWECTG